MPMFGLLSATLPKGPSGASGENDALAARGDCANVRVDYADTQCGQGGRLSSPANAGEGDRPKGGGEEPVVR